MLNRLFCLIACCLLLPACGGGHASSNTKGSSTVSTQTQLSSIPATSSIAASSITASIEASSVAASSIASVTPVKISGTITYDYVPHNLTHIGLNYSAIEKRPVRNAIVELLDSGNNISQTTSTNDTGDYQFSVSQNTDYKIRVKAQSKSSISPSWNFSVQDNTSGDALYSMAGNLVTSGTSDSVRDLNAQSGWDTASFSYQSTRTAAPFAILDSLYTGVKRFQSFGNTKNYPLLAAHWSTKNKSVDGDIAVGEITTTYYSGNDIYILGDANNDIDEYDPSPILHEFGHYIENFFFRSDSIGGNHAAGDSLDMRVSMSEGFANAFSGIMLGNPIYEDASGTGQTSGGFFNINKKQRVNKGYYDEGSVESIFYNYYAATDLNKNANDATKIFSVMASNAYINAPAFTSIFLFFDFLTQKFPDQQNIFSTLLLEQNINGIDQYGANEANSGGLQTTLPIYKIILADNSTVNVCSSSMFGKYNNLGNSAFLKLVLNAQGSYTISAAKAASNLFVSKPEIVVYERGQTVWYAKNHQDDINTFTAGFAPDTYIIEVYDLSNHDAKNTDQNTLCFDLHVVKN